MTSQLAVFNEEEFRRIRDLPRRSAEWTDEETNNAIEILTAALRTPWGTMRLKKIQARALVEAHDTGGLVGEIVAGGGKALLSFLLPVVLEKRSTLLLVPAHLKLQTADVHAALSKDWKLPPLYGGPQSLGTQYIRVLSYQALSTVGQSKFLEENPPDLIIADEAHFLARTKSARSRRVFRFLRDRARAGVKVIFIPLSGTMRRRKITECAYLYSAALPGRSPWPEHWPVLQQWSAAIDEGISPDARIQPGALLDLCTPEEAASGLDGVRRAIRRRLVETPSVVASTESGVDVPLTLQAREIKIPQEVFDALADLRNTGKLPNDSLSDGGLADWNHAREMACGFCYRYETPPPDEWKEAKKAWTRFVRDALNDPKLKLDSPLMVWNAVEAGAFGDVKAFHDWNRLRDTFKPNTVPQWLSDYLVQDAEEWALRTGGIVWVSHSSAFTKADPASTEAPDNDDAIGKAFKRIPYFGGGPAGEGIKTHRGPCVASIRARGTGANLQQWSRALIMCLPSSGATLEQLLARHHRLGQQADDVLVEFYVHSFEMFDALRKVKADSRYAEALNGSPQRVNYCTILGPDGHAFDESYYADRLTDRSNPIWYPDFKKEK